MPQVSARKKLLEAGFRVLYEYGVNGCSIQDITDAAGVPKGSFYNHFKSKEMLALEVLDLYVNRARLDLLQDTSLSPLSRLEAHFRFLDRLYGINGQGVGCMFGNFALETSAATPKLSAALVTRLGGWNAVVTQVIVEAQAAGEVAVDRDAAQLARFTVAAWEGATLAMKLNRSAVPIEDFFSLVFPMLAKAPAPF
jgi:TetR/AcrR family transcriptional repressor of nem operon